MKKVYLIFPTLLTICSSISMLSSCTTTSSSTLTTNISQPKDTTILSSTDDNKDGNFVNFEEHFTNYQDFKNFYDIFNIKNSGKLVTIDPDLLETTSISFDFSSAPFDVNQLDEGNKYDYLFLNPTFSFSFSRQVNTYLSDETSYSINGNSYVFTGTEELSLDNLNLVCIENIGDLSWEYSIVEDNFTLFDFNIYFSKKDSNLFISLLTQINDNLQIIG